MALLTAATWDMVRAQRARTLTQVGTVYGRGGTGRWDQVVKANLACHLAYVSPQNAAGGSERAELLSVRRLEWEPDYVLPEDSMVGIAGDMWRPTRGTFANLVDDNGASYERSCDVTRQQS